MPNRWAGLVPEPARSRTVVSGGDVLERRAAPKERIERGMNARGAGCDTRQRFRTRTHTEARCAGCGSPQRGSAKRSCSCRLGSWRCMPQLGSLWARPPNPPFQPTAAREIVRFLKPFSGALAAAERQPVSPPFALYLPVERDIAIPPEL